MATPITTPQFIRYGDKELAMDAGMTLAQAKALMARHFPELSDPKVETATTDGRTVHTFTKQAGRKGADVLERLQKLTRMQFVKITKERVPRNAQWSGNISEAQILEEAYGSNSIREQLRASAATIERLLAIPLALTAGDTEPLL